MRRTTNRERVLVRVEREASAEHDERDRKVLQDPAHLERDGVHHPHVAKQDARQQRAAQRWDTKLGAEAAHRRGKDDEQCDLKRRAPGRVCVAQWVRGYATRVHGGVVVNVMRACCCSLFS